MEKLEDLNKRVLFLRKRFREPDMREIFEHNSRSLIETLNKMSRTTHSETKSTNLFQFKEKSLKEDHQISNGTNYVTSQVSNHSFPTNNSMFINEEAVGENNQLLDSEKKSVCSSKDSKRRSEDKSRSKSKVPSSKALKRPPEDNLMNLEWRASNKLSTPLTKTTKSERPVINSNCSSSTSNVNDTHKGSHLNPNRKDSSNSKYSSTNTNPNVIKETTTIANLEVTSLTNKINYSHFTHESNTLNLDVKMTNENDIDTLSSRNEVSELVKVEGRKSEDNCEDCFYDQKEELFDHTLPPEVMGGSPVYKDEEAEDEYESKHKSSNNQMMVDADEENEPNPGLSKPRSGISGTGTKFAIPVDSIPDYQMLTEKAFKNTTKSEGNKQTSTLVQSNSINMASSNNSNISQPKKKNAKIIDDEDEEEVMVKNPQNSEIKINGHQSSTSELNCLPVQEATQNNPQNNPQNIPQSSNKIKISFADMGGILPQNLEDGRKSVVSSKSNDKKNNLNVKQNVSYTVPGNTKMQSAAIVELDKARLDPKIKTMMAKTKTESSSRSVTSNKSKETVPVKKISEHEFSFNSDLPKEKPVQTNSNGIKATQPANGTNAPNRYNGITPTDSHKSKPSISKHSSLNSSSSKEEAPVNNSLYVHKDTMKEMLEEANDIKKVNNTALFLANFRSSIQLIQKKLEESQNCKRNSTDQEVSAEFESILSSLNSIKEDSSYKGIKLLLEKSSKIIIKLLGLLHREENFENYSVEINDVIDCTNEVVKKMLSKEEKSFRIIKHWRVLLKFTSAVVKLKYNYRTPKLKSLISEAELCLNKKTFEVKTPLANIIKFTSLSKAYNNNCEKLIKFLKELQREEEERLKNKKVKSQEFSKECEKLKTRIQTAPQYLHIKKLYKLIKRYSDLTGAHVKDSE